MLTALLRQSQLIRQEAQQPSVECQPSKCMLQGVISSSWYALIS